MALHVRSQFCSITVFGGPGFLVAGNGLVSGRIRRGCRAAAPARGDEDPPGTHFPHFPALSYYGAVAEREALSTGLFSATRDERLFSINVN